MVNLRVLDTSNSAQEQKLRSQGALKKTYVAKIEEKSPNDKLLDAASIGDHRAVEKALQAGADVNYANYKGETPLHEAIPMGYAPTCVGCHVHCHGGVRFLDKTADW